MTGQRYVPVRKATTFTEQMAQNQPREGPTPYERPEHAAIEEEPEEWRPIPGYGNRYYISSLGRIKRVGLAKVLLMRPYLHKGRPYIQFVVNGHKRSLSVHRLMGLVFMQGAVCLRHRNGDKKDNRVPNLVDISTPILHTATDALNSALEEYLREEPARGRIRALANRFNIPYHSLRKLVAKNSKATEVIIENEVWVSIVGYEGVYQVSSCGRVKGRKLLKPRLNDSGYELVALASKGKALNMRVHRLVAIAFIPNPNNLPEVNHKDGNKRNNRLDNLEWCTSQENIQHAYRNGLNSGRWSRKSNKQANNGK